MRDRMVNRRNVWWLGLCLTLGWPIFTAGAADRDPPPERGVPYPGYGRHASYEDVLDHSDLVFVGRVITRHPFQSKLSEEQPETPGHLELEVHQVLRGEYTNRMADIIHGSGNLPALEKTTNLHAFLVLRAPGGTLRLAGEPPLGGGYISEGPWLAGQLLEAARDPVKGFASTNLTLRLSSACRLAKAWLATPEKDRPAPPPRLMETLLDGLRGYAHGLSQNVDASAWNAINALLDCNIHDIWDYPPGMKKGRRSKLADDVSGAWERTREAIQKQRKEDSGVSGPDDQKRQMEVALLIEQLASDDFPERQAAQDALVRIGRPAMKLVTQGAQNENPKIAAGCRLLSMLIPQLRDFRPDDQSHIFDLKRAAPLVPSSPLAPPPPSPLATPEP